MAYSSVGRIQLAAHAFLLLVTILSLALSARVNQFQDFFFVADLFPLALSIITFVFLVVMLLLDAMVPSSYTARPQFHIGLFGILSIVWLGAFHTLHLENTHKCTCTRLAGNAFSTSRWRHIPMACGAIPDGSSQSTYHPNLPHLSLSIPEFADERSWCKDVQALKAFVWIEWVTSTPAFLVCPVIP